MQAIALHDTSKQRSTATQQSLQDVLAAAGAGAKGLWHCILHQIQLERKTPWKNRWGRTQTDPLHAACRGRAA